MKNESMTSKNYGVCSVEYSTSEDKLYFSLAEYDFEDFLSSFELLQKIEDHSFFVEGAELTSTLFHKNTELITFMNLYNYDLSPSAKPMLAFEYGGGALIGHFNLPGVNMVLEELKKLENSEVQKVTIKTLDYLDEYVQNNRLKEPSRLVSEVEVRVLKDTK